MRRMTPYAVIFLLFASSAPAADWPMWGGDPQRNMVNTVEKNIPSTWDIDTGRNIKWTAELGSQTYGNPVISGGKLFVGTNNGGRHQPNVTGDKGVILCFSEDDGKLLWQMTHDKLPAGRVNDWPQQGICSSPAVDGNRLYYVSNRCELICADTEGFLDGENDGPFTGEQLTDKIDGDIVWKLDMLNELGAFPHNLATSSPTFDEDLVYVSTSNGVDEGHIVLPVPLAPSFIAVNKRTGEVVWESNAPGENVLHGQWSSPAVGIIGGEKQVIFPGGDGRLYSFAAKTGEELWSFDCNPADSVWELGGMGTRNNIIATPVIYDDKVFIAVGQDPEHGEGPGPLVAVAATKRGDLTQPARPAPSAARESPPGAGGRPRPPGLGNALLRHFGIGEARVGQVDLHRRRPGMPIHCAGAACNGLVVLPSLAVLPSKEEVVHGPLRGGGHPQGPQQDINHPLGGLHVAAHHRRVR